MDYNFYDAGAPLERRVAALIGWWRYCAKESADGGGSTVVMADQLERVLTLRDVERPVAWWRVLVGRCR
jgi:hypothetical protein